MIDITGLLALQWLLLPASAIVLATVLAAAMSSRRRTLRRLREAETTLAESAARLAALEQLAADCAGKIGIVGRKLGELGDRQDKIAAVRIQTGLRHAITLSRQGATNRQLVDACGLSQGEAHLVLSLYGRAAEASTGSATQVQH